MTKTKPATFAPICSSMIGCASRSAMIPQSTTTREHAVVDGAHVAAAPGAHAAAAGPQDVGDRATIAFEQIELRLEQDPRAEERDHAAEQRARAGADASCASAALMPRPWMSVPARQERHVEQRRQHHAEQRAGEEDAPLIGADDAPPAAPAPHGLGVGLEDEAGVRQVHLLCRRPRRGCSRRAAPMP